MRLPSPYTKLGRVLNALMTGESYNFIEAAEQLHDRSLHSTISTLANVYGIEVSRAYEVVPGYGGAKTRCRRYWIEFDERVRIKRAIRDSNTESKSDEVSTSSDVSEIESVTHYSISFLRTAVRGMKDGIRALARF